MKRLILMRHAKSEWQAGVSDIERSLNPRGLRSAQALGDWLRDQDILPNQILCSAATRTRETLAGLNLAEDIPITFSKALYLAEPDAMLQLLRKQSAETVLMVAHNPGIAMLAQTLVATPPQHEQFRKYPSGATLVADFDVSDWHDIDAGSATPHRFVVPRELPQMAW